MTTGRTALQAAESNSWGGSQGEPSADNTSENRENEGLGPEGGSGQQHPRIHCNLLCSLGLFVSYHNTILCGNSSPGFWLILFSWENL